MKPQRPRRASFYATGDRTNAGGTFIPQYQWSAAPGVAGVTLRGSYFRLTPVGINTMKAVGAWS